MRGEGNHKIPGSFAPENMEKTGAERVKYSLACQHEDAIPIKFVSYAQKCPTVLCTFAVALRKESVDRNFMGPLIFNVQPRSLSARRAWIEMLYQLYDTYAKVVALRKESVDRNINVARAADRVLWSLSARRAWIEIKLSWRITTRTTSLSARRAWIEISNIIRYQSRGSVSLSARRAWIEICTVSMPPW